MTDLIDLLDKLNTILQKFGIIICYKTNYSYGFADTYYWLCDSKTKDILKCECRWDNIENIFLSGVSKWMPLYRLDFDKAFINCHRIYTEDNSYDELNNVIHSLKADSLEEVQIKLDLLMG